MNIEILFLGKTKEAYLQQGIEDFAKRLCQFNAIELVDIKVKKQSGTELQIRSYESSLLEKRITSGSYRVVVDGRGRQLSSEGLAGFITKLENRAVKTLSFIIGGPVGLAEDQREKADTMLALSQMTFTHDMARLILLEQLYRAFTIKAGTRYHK